MDKKKVYEKAKIKVIHFDQDDIIVTSSGPNNPNSLVTSLFITRDAVKLGGVDEAFWN